LSTSANDFRICWTISKAKAVGRDSDLPRSSSFPTVRTRVRPRVLSTTSVDLAGVHALLTTEAFVENVYENGEKTVVIGDNGYGDTIAISIIGGVIHATSSGYAEYDDVCGDTVGVPDESENSHPYKEGISKDDLIDAIKNPFGGQRWTDGHMYYYISQAANGVWFVTRASPDNPFSPLGISTTLIGEFDDGQDAEKYLEDQGKTPDNC
jgi:hypothetical protein